jgi:hypothetical protein
VAALNILAHAIDKANSVRSDGWYVKDDQGALAVMSYRYLCLVDKQGLWISVIGPVHEQEYIALGVGTGDKHRGGWAQKEVPGGLRVRVPAEKIALAMDVIGERFDRFIEISLSDAHRDVESYKQKDGHWPEVLAYIEGVVGRSLPRPVFKPKGPARSGEIAAEPFMESSVEAESERPSEAAVVPEFASVLAQVRSNRDYHFEPRLVAQLHAGLWAHPRRHFAILAGLSGSGKTVLAREYAKALTGGDRSREFTLSVQPGWHDPGALLGFTNPLRGNSYSRTAFLNYLLAAVNEPGRPYLVVLDEMNLSHPEQYMAPLLSVMETGGHIELHSEGEDCDGVPSKVPYPNNLVLIGTVNMDETTHGLSDKVLDRAFVLEFWEVDLSKYPRWNDRALPPADVQRAREVLERLMEVLSPVRLHFGWRVVDEVLNFLSRASGTGGHLPFEVALDQVIYAKVLPKLRGDDTPRFRHALEQCIKQLVDFKLLTSAGKVKDLFEDVKSTGSARFWR